MQSVARQLKRGNAIYKSNNDGSISVTTRNQVGQKNWRNILIKEMSDYSVSEIKQRIRAVYSDDKIGLGITRNVGYKRTLSVLLYLAIKKEKYNSLFHRMLTRKKRKVKKRKVRKSKSN